MEGGFLFCNVVLRKGKNLFSNEIPALKKKLKEQEVRRLQEVPESTANQLARKLFGRGQRLSQTKLTEANAALAASQQVRL